MSAAKHTPGPWRVEDDVPSDPRYADHRFVFLPGCCSVSGHMGEANARLIAAAPELLEALAQLLHAEGVSRGVMLGNARAAAYAAIAKARGEA